MANKPMETCPVSLVTREMKMNMVRHHFTPTRMALIKKRKTSLGEDVENLKPSLIAGGKTIVRPL